MVYGACNAQSKLCPFKLKICVQDLYLSIFVDVMPVQALDGVFDLYYLLEHDLLYILIPVSLTTPKHAHTQTHPKAFHHEISL